MSGILGCLTAAESISKLPTSLYHGGLHRRKPQVYGSVGTEKGSEANPHLQDRDCILDPKM